MKLFAQIRKVDEDKRLVYGRAAEEVVDKADEIMDYASSKPHFVKWSEDIAKDTDGKSLGNVRAMHGKVAAGKLTAIDFNDTDKAIDVCAKVVDDAEWKKVLEGVYTGFSIGGSYVGEKKVEKADGRDVSRYTARPTEVSLVDRPCMPTAKFFEVQKADGSLQKVDFQAPAVDPDEVTVNGSADEVALLGKAMNEAGLSIADVIAKITAPAEVAKVEEAPLAKVEAGSLRKSLYGCQSLIGLIDSLACLKKSAEYEAMYEGDPEDRAIAQELQACIAMCGSTVQRMFAHELGELTGGPMEMAERAGALAKLDGDEQDPLLALLKIGARNSAADAGRLAKIHALINELGHPCAVTEKAEPEGDLAKVDAGALEKLVADAMAPLQKALADATADLTKLKAQPAPARIALRAISKAEDVGDLSAPAPAAPQPITDAHGDAHEAAGLIKSLHQSGGAPLRK